MANIGLVKEILEMATGYNLKRLRIGGLEIEWSDGGSAKKAEVVLPVAREVDTKADAASDPLAEIPPDLAEQTDEQMLLYSSAAYATASDKKAKGAISTASAIHSPHHRQWRPCPA